MTKSGSCWRTSRSKRGSGPEMDKGRLSQRQESRLGPALRRGADQELSQAAQGRLFPEGRRRQPGRADGRPGPEAPDAAGQEAAMDRGRAQGVAVVRGRGGG